MKRLVDLLAVVAALFLGVGYLASQLAYMNGRPSEHALRMDHPSIRILATLLLAGALLLAFLNKPEADPE